MNNIDEFKNAKYGLMIHFGLYSLLDKKDQLMPNGLNARKKYLIQR